MTTRVIPPPIPGRDGYAYGCYANRHPVTGMLVCTELGAWFVMARRRCGHFEVPEPFCSGHASDIEGVSVGPSACGVCAVEGFATVEILTHYTEHVTDLALPPLCVRADQTLPWDTYARTSLTPQESRFAVPPGWRMSSREDIVNCRYCFEMLHA